jgi:tRNA threonylcarbamoyladenosine biosynthesis protein TsaB
MKLLLLNTCGSEGMIALAEGDTVVAVESLPGRGSSEELMPAMRRVFAAADWAASDVGAIGVVHGPGSFTGVRVGLSAAKGLCDALGVGMVAISRLALLAGASGAPETVVLLDAGRGEFYGGIYREEECVREALLRRNEVLALASQTQAASFLSCDARVVDSLAELSVRLVEEPDADAVLRLAIKRVKAGDWADVDSIDANYLRRTDAELLVERRVTELAGPDATWRA